MMEYLAVALLLIVPLLFVYLALDAAKRLE